MSQNTYQKPPISIVIFENNKRKSDKSPLKNGTITFTEEFHFSPGDTLDVAIWGKTSAKGNAFESGIIKLPDPKYSKPAYTGGQSKSSSVDMVDF